MLVNNALIETVLINKVPAHVLLLEALNNLGSGWQAIIPWADGRITGLRHGDFTYHLEDAPMEHWCGYHWMITQDIPKTGQGGSMIRTLDYGWINEIEARGIIDKLRKIAAN